jgi:hypothetical protein
MAVLAGVTVAGTSYAGEDLVLAGVTVKDRTVFRVLAALEDDGIRVRDEVRPLLAGMCGRRPAWR